MDEGNVVGVYRQFRWKRDEQWVTYDAYTEDKDLIIDINRVLGAKPK